MTHALPAPSIGTDFRAHSFAPSPTQRHALASTVLRQDISIAIARFDVHAKEPNEVNHV